MLLLKEIVVRYQNNKVIMQNCLLSVYYLSHMSVINKMDSTTYMIFDNFVKENDHDPGIAQRFAKVCQKLKDM